MSWLIAAGVVLALSFFLLLVALAASSVALVYLSIAASFAWVPLLVVGLVLRAKSTRAS